MHTISYIMAETFSIIEDDRNVKRFVKDNLKFLKMLQKYQLFNLFLNDI